MNGKMKHNISLGAGAVTILADLYWTYTSYYDTTWLALGVIIFLATVVWLWADM